MATLRAAFVVSMVLVVGGCQEEHPTSHPQIFSSAVNPAAPATNEVGPGTTDSAAQVMGLCGRPGSDTVLAIYDKLNNGPVRRMVYRHLHRVITVDFTPSHPLKRDPNASRHAVPPARLPAGSVWRFDEASVPKELDMITAARVAVFLPCAGAALKAEY
jgi:hypothetical protein